MSDFTGLAIAGRVATPQTPTGTRRASPGTSPPTRRRARSRSPRAPTDVAAAVRFASQNGLRVAGQGTGHGAVALGPLDDTILIQTARHARHRDRPRRADGAGRRRRLGARAERSRAEARASARCPAPPPTSASVGYTLGGGLSWLRPQARVRLQPGRRDRAGHRRRRATHGRRRQRARPVLGDARRRRRLRRSSPPCTSTCCRSPRSTPGRSSSRPRSAPRRSAAYREWTRGPAARRSPRSSASCTPPPLPDVPEPLRGTPLLTIDAACIGGEEAGRRAIAPLLRDRRADHEHVRPDPGRRASAGSTWTPSPRSPALATTAC